MRKMERLKRGKILGAFVLAGMVFWLNGTVSRADAGGKIKYNSVVVRQEASTNSEAIASSSKGTAVTVKGKTTDSTGAIWYQIVVEDGKLGYVRSDLINVDGDVPQLDGGAGEAAAGQGTGGAGGASVDAETPMNPQYATASKTAKVRSGPSTNDDVVDSIPAGTQVIVSGQSAGSDKPWYYVTFTASNGAERTGFIRSDLLNLGEILPIADEPAAEPEVPVETEPEAEVQKDYDVVIESDGTYYLYDYTGGKGNVTKQNLLSVLNAAHGRDEQANKNAGTVVKQRIVIIVLAVLLVAAIVAVVIMAVKLRDAYYEDYEDDEDEDEEEEETEEEEQRPVRERRTREQETVRRTDNMKAADRARNADRERKDERRRTAGKEADYREGGASDAEAKQTPRRKAKNFLLDDDDFEFEFLNVDDKNL